MMEPSFQQRNEKNANSCKHGFQNFETVFQPLLDAETFMALAEESGWCRMTQDGLMDEKRRPFVLEPQPLSVVLKDQSGQVIAALGGTNYGAYAYGQYAMVREEYKGQGLGTHLMRLFQEELNRLNGGETSIAVFAHPESFDYLQRRGFIPLKNALVLKRGNSIVDTKPSL